MSDVQETVTTNRVPENIRSVFISDLHLGSSCANVEALLEFLIELKEEGDPKYIYLVGDVFDAWKVGWRWDWDDTHTLVVRKLLSFMRDGSRIYYVTGNHDGFLRQFSHSLSGMTGNLFVTDQVLHEGPNGGHYLVTHGDSFDYSMRYPTWLVRLGDITYSFLLCISRSINWLRMNILRRRARWSLSRYIKHHTKNTSGFLADYEEFLTLEADDLDCIGVICGHIHMSGASTRSGIRYFNCGDWIESRTALIEKYNGEMVLYKQDP